MIRLSLYSRQVTHPAGAYNSFHSMKQRGLLLAAHPHYQEILTPSPSPSDGMPLHCKLIPLHFLGLADNMVVPIILLGGEMRWDPRWNANALYTYPPAFFWA